jgi:hypothetical protein
MKERPILFSAPMVRAILEDRKTVTRRIVKRAMIAPAQFGLPLRVFDERYIGVELRCPYGQPGDRLWVRETARVESESINHVNPSKSWHSIDYRAGGSSSVRSGRVPKWFPSCSFNKDGQQRWQSAIHMPRWASRITLEVTGVRVERLQDITREGAASEGMCMDLDGTLPEWFRRDRWPEENFAALWDQINGESAWHANPWVWVVEFKRVRMP